MSSRPILKPFSQPGYGPSEGDMPDPSSFTHGPPSYEPSYQGPLPNNDVGGLSRSELVESANHEWAAYEPREGASRQAFAPYGNRERIFDRYEAPDSSRISSDEISLLSTSGSELTIAAAWVIDASKLTIEAAKGTLPLDSAIDIVSKNLDFAISRRTPVPEMTPYRVLLTASWRVNELIYFFRANLDPTIVSERQQRSAAYRATTSGEYGKRSDAYFARVPVASAIAGMNSMYAQPDTGKKRPLGIDYNEEGLAAMQTLRAAIDGLFERMRQHQQ